MSAEAPQACDYAPRSLSSIQASEFRLRLWKTAAAAAGGCTETDFTTLLCSPHPSAHTHMYIYFPAGQHSAVEKSRVGGASSHLYLFHTFQALCRFQLQKQLPLMSFPDQVKREILCLKYFFNAMIFMRPSTKPDLVAMSATCSSSAVSLAARSAAARGWKQKGNRVFWRSGAQITERLGTWRGSCNLCWII